MAHALMLANDGFHTATSAAQSDAATREAGGVVGLIFIGQRASLRLDAGCTPGACSLTQPTVAR